MNQIIFKITSIIFAIALAMTAVGSASASSENINIQAAGITYYVNGTTGSDSNPGTQTRPWRTIQKAANSLKAGDTVKVLAGRYATRVRISRSGSAGFPITFVAAGKVIMAGFTVNASYINIRGFEITNTPDDDIAGFGIYLNGSYCKIENNYIHDATRGGIFLQADIDNYAGTSRNVVRKNRLMGNAQVGIEVQGQNNLIEGNEVAGTIQYHPKVSNPPSWVDADGIYFFGTGHIIRKNYIHDIKFGIPENPSPHIDCLQSWSDSYHLPAKNITIEQNRCLNAQAQNDEEIGKGIMVTDNQGWLVIRNNVIHAFVNIYLENAQNVRVVNNTLSSDPTLNPDYYPSGMTINYSTNMYIRNNLFYNQPGHIIYVRDSNLESGNNLAYRNDGEEIWSTNTYNHTADLWDVNPMLVNPETGDYHLQVGSPAINAGLNLTDVKIDFDGVARPSGQRLDIGAFEKVKP